MFISTVQKRRSIRKFTDKPVETEKIDTIIEAALRSPSAMAKRPWEFVVVTDKELLFKLSEAKPGGAAFLKNATVGIVVCADPKVSGNWVEDASIASVFMQLAATSLDLGSCWAHFRDKNYNDSTTSKEYIGEILNLPTGLNIESIIGIGYPDEEKAPYSKDELAYDKVNYNIYGNKSL